jgi:hypothetical protein
MPVFVIKYIAKPHDHILIMSNKGFARLKSKLLAALAK